MAQRTRALRLSLSLSSASLGGHTWSHVFKTIPNGCPTGISNLAGPRTTLWLPAFLSQEAVSLLLCPRKESLLNPWLLCPVHPPAWQVLAISSGQFQAVSSLVSLLLLSSLQSTLPGDCPPGQALKSASQSMPPPSSFPRDLNKSQLLTTPLGSCIFWSFLSNSALGVPPSLCREWLPGCYVSPLITQGLAALPGARLRRPLNARWQDTAMTQHPEEPP